MADDRIKLGLDIGDSAAKAKSLADSLGDVKESAQDVASTYQVMASASSSSEAAYGRIGSAADRATRSGGAFNQSIINTSRGLQDFAAGWQSNGVQGAFIGISNNMESLASIVARTPQQVLGLTVAFNALGAALPFIARGLSVAWKEFQKWGSDMKLDGIAALEKGLEDVKGQVEAIAAADVWNLDVIQKYNGLLQSQAAIEKEIADRKKHRNDYEAFMASTTPEDKAAVEDVSKGFTEVFGGRGKELQGELIAGLEAEAQETRKRLREQKERAEATLRNPNLLASDYARARKQIAAIEKQMVDVGKTINTRAVEILSNAAGGGDFQTRRNALDEIAKYGSDAVKADVDRVVSTDWTGRHGESPEQKAEREKQAAKEGEARGEASEARKAKRREDMKVAATSTPEELAQSEAIEAIQNRGVGKDWSDKEWNKAAEQAVAASNTGMGGKDALDAGIAAVSGARAKLGDAAQLRGLEGDINRGTGGQLTAEQVGDAAKRAQGYIASGVNPDMAKDAAVRELIAANAELMRTVQELQDGTAQSVQAARWQRQQASQMRQMNPSILNRGGG